MAHTRTRNDLVNQALANLGVLAAGQPASAEDFEAVDNMVEPMFAWLEATENITIDNIDQIPPEWFNNLAVLLADDAALMFGLPGMPPSQSEPQPVRNALDNLKLVTYGRPTYEPQKTEYF